MQKVDPRHVARLTVVVVFALLNTFCATVDRGRDRHTLSVDGEYAHAGNRTYGCDGGLTSEERHHQAGAKVTYRYERRTGFNLQADAGVARGELGNHFGFTPYKTSYTMGSGGLMLGYDWKHVGLDVGVGLVLDDEGRSLVAPRFEGRLGNMARGWWSVGVGPVDAPFDGRLLYTGAGFRGDWGRVDFGVAFLGRPMPSLENCDSSLQIGILAEDNADLGAYGTLRLFLGRGVGVDLGAVASESYSFRLGLSFDL